MMFTARMIKLFAVVLDHDADKVTEELLREGVMQLINISRVEPEWQERISDVTPQVSMARIADIRKRIEGYLAPLGIYPESPKEVDLEGREPVALDEASRKLDRIADEIREISERQRSVQQEILRLEDIYRQIQLFGPGLSGAALRTQYSFIDVRVGTVPVQHVQSLHDETREVPSVILQLEKDGADQPLLIIFMKRDSDRIGRILDEAGWKDLEISEDVQNMKPEIAQDIEKKISGLMKEQESLHRVAKTRIGEHGDELQRLWVQLRVNELFYRVQSYFKHSSRTVIFSGWLPESKRTTLENNIRRVTSGRCFLEWYAPDLHKREAEKEENAPVLFKNPRFLAPFQMLVKNFGVPEYGTIDPTPFVMVTYLIMFGLMFADVGQGAVLVFLGVLGTFFFKGKKEQLRNLSQLIVWCGAASMSTGVLFGSYFGQPWFEPVWFDFHGIISGRLQGQSVINDIFDILAITVYFGIAVIGCGLVFNWINIVLKKRWTELVFDKGGLLGGWIYFGGVYVARYMVMNGYKTLPDVSAIFWLVGLPALLLFIKTPLHFVRSKSKGGGKKFTLLTPIDFGMEWVVELLEVFAGYLSNTLSFMRVAGLGIAHVSLMISFFELARMAREASSMQVSPWSILIIVVGNVIVIGLEGLTAGIQALRLNYYEFFTKFFRGSGEVFSPVSLTSRD
jgi:V/A-type H+-transporting ATPase subunit I